LRKAARTPSFRSARDLVVHQRDQRRHDDAGARAQQRRHLVAQDLPPPVGISTSASPPPTTCSTIAACGPRNCG
jgi:hypothetical protein